MINRILFLLLALMSGNAAFSQDVVTQAVNEYLKKNHVTTVTDKDTALLRMLRKSKQAYILKDSKTGNISISVPKGAISFAPPKGDSVVYAKVTSPHLSENSVGILYITQYVQDKVVESRKIGMGEVNANTGVRVDITVDNKEKPFAQLYFLVGMIQGEQLRKSSKCLIKAFNIPADKKLTYDVTVPALLFYEDTLEGENEKQIRQWFSSMLRKQFFAKLGKKLNNYSLISYKLLRKQ